MTYKLHVCNPFTVTAFLMVEAYSVNVRLDFYRRDPTCLKTCIQHIERNSGIPKSSDNMAMAKVFVWSLCLFTLLSAFHSGTCTAMPLHTCTGTPDSCTCTGQVTEPVEVYKGENFTTTMSIKFRTITMDELYSNVSKISLVRYDKDIITGFRIDDPYYSGRWTPHFSFEPSSTECVEVKVTVSVRGAEFNDDGKYHLEARTKTMTYTTRDQPLTVHVNPVNEGQQTNVTSAEFKDEGNYHLEATTQTMTSVTSGDTKDGIPKHNIMCDQACIEDLLRKSSPSLVSYGMQLATFLFSVCAVMLLAVLLVLKIRNRRHTYAPVSTHNKNINIQANILQVKPCPGLELGALSKPNAANGNAVETDSAA